MKQYAVTAVFVLLGFVATAQKYALIDRTLSQPIHYTDTVSVVDVQKKFFPIEKKELRQFERVLKRIYRQLKDDTLESAPKQFLLGCVTIDGTTVFVKNSPRYSYTLSFNCDNVSARYLLCDSKLKNTTNAFIVSTWIKYLSARE